MKQLLHLTNEKKKNVSKKEHSHELHLFLKPVDSCINSCKAPFTQVTFLTMLVVLLPGFQKGRDIKAS
jgi:hypothetical protein